jgi:predicted RNA polymerase sigma factor
MPCLRFRAHVRPHARPMTAACCSSPSRTERAGTQRSWLRGSPISIAPRVETIISRFHLEAGIAACHAAAPSYYQTNWPQIVSLYDLLRPRAPSPIVEVNRAIAVAMASGAWAGLDELDAIPERDLIGSYPYALAAYAELHASLGHIDEARAYLARALDHQPSQVQQALLQRTYAALAR